MKSTLTAILLVVFVLRGSWAVSVQSGGKQQHHGVFAVLHKDQSASLQEANGRCEISIMPNGPQPPAYKVVEVGRDFVVLQNIGQVIQTRIPVYSIKAATVININGQR